MKNYTDAPVPSNPAADFALWKRYVDEQLARMTSTKNSRTLVAGTTSGSINGTAASGTLTWGVTFTGLPEVIATVNCGSNFDLVINVFNRTTTGCSFRVAQSRLVTVSGTFSIHWFAYGTLQAGITL